VATELDSSPGSSAAVDSSHLRVRMKPAASAAARRVSNYLRALGLSDRARVRDLSQRIALSVTADNAEQHAARAVAEAQARFESWRSALHSALPEGVDPLWLRAFIAARPEHFLGADMARAKRAARNFGDPSAGTGPRLAKFRPQEFERARMPSSFLGLVPPIVMTWAASCTLWHAITLDGWTWVELGWISLFVFLFFQAAAGFSTATIGFLARLFGRAPTARTRPAELDRPQPDARGEDDAAQASSLEASAVVARAEREAHDAEPDGALVLPRTALLMPIYHESAEDVFAALAGMRESLAALPEGKAFDVFVLSDSRNPEVCAEEERAFRRVAAASDGIPIYYHRRARNERQKAGNLAEFFERWGPRYTYAITLDADSVMSGETLVELIRRMEANPKLGLLQAPLTVHRAETLFARTLAFSASLCGPIFTHGLSLWSGRHGNFYGHNAAVRVSAFLDCCALPRLNGEPPFGGHVLSHDFVEAALLCRAGWEVRTAYDLEGGSYEELPPTLVDYVARDHRWCQGNMQHLRIAGMHGIEPMSRIHLLLGAFAYLASPAWFAFVVLGLVAWQQTGPAFAEVAEQVGLATAAILVAPWVLGVLDGLRHRARRRTHGGALRLVPSGVLGLVLGALVAPLLMIHHTRIVLSILSGRAVSWGAQQRRASGNFTKIVRAEWPATLLGLGLGAWTLLAQASLSLWFAPLWVPWALAIPLNLAVSSAAFGGLARRLGLLIVPTESEPEELLRRIDELRVLTRRDASARFRDLVLDPVLVASHCAKLGGNRPSATPKRLAELRTRALREGPASLSAHDWKTLAEDAESMQLLHREAWRRWPVEAWDLGREEPQLPPETARPVLATSNGNASNGNASNDDASSNAGSTAVATRRSERTCQSSSDLGDDVASSGSNDAIAPSFRSATLHPASRRTR
jgi:membrane glycosyltransferase